MKFAVSILLCTLMCQFSHQLVPLMQHGEPVPEGIPFLVGIITFDHSGDILRQCAGALISDNYVLTAQQCILRNTAIGNSILEVEAAKAQIFKGGFYFMDEPLITVFPKDWIRYQHYRSHPVLRNDLLLIRLPSKIPHGKPIGLPCNVNIHELDGLTGNVAGWGPSSILADSLNLQRNILQYVPANIDLHLCKNQGRFCATSDLDRSPCKGDNGSPLVVDGNIVGILSIGENADICNSFNNELSVSEYTSILEKPYLKWIEKVANISCNAYSEEDATPAINA
ncbi:granzyme M-like [Anthonomus grandis grandis]|uniref:granzyme M-like n=1 Tax=Anthonomus grandis grandis TaxID=2921223 RepID=UPI002165FD6A|nr:granzyme M-like [Anthonomus grandis grandis]